MPRHFADEEKQIGTQAGVSTGERERKREVHETSSPLRKVRSIQLAEATSFFFRGYPILAK